MPSIQRTGSMYDSSLPCYIFLGKEKDLASKGVAVAVQGEHLQCDGPFPAIRLHLLLGALGFGGNKPVRAVQAVQACSRLREAIFLLRRIDGRGFRYVVLRRLFTLTRPRCNRRCMIVHAGRNFGTESVYCSSSPSLTGRCNMCRTSAMVILSVKH